MCRGVRKERLRKRASKVPREGGLRKKRAWEGYVTVGHSQLVGHDCVERLGEQKRTLGWQEMMVGGQ